MIISGDMGTQPLNGNDATAVLGFVAKWSAKTTGPAVAELVKTLRGAGYTSVPEKHDVPTWARTLPSKMPHDVYGGTTDDGARVPGLYDLLLAHPDKADEIRERLMTGVEPDDENRLESVYAEAQRDANHSMRIDGLRIELYNAIHEARQAGLRAEATIARLEGDDVYDVAIAESADAVYLKAFVADIRRAGAAAYRFLPFDENGSDL